MRSAVIKGRKVRLLPEALPVGSAARTDADEHAACSTGTGPVKVEVQREGDATLAIEVTCPCGHVMVLDCIYDDAEQVPEEQEGPPAGGTE